MSTHDTNSRATAAAARFVAGTRYDDLSSDLVDMGKKHILDGIGVALAGTKSDVAKVIWDYVGKFSGERPVSLIGSSVRVPARFAALANATVMHAEDFDDTNQPTGGSAKTGGVHSTTVVFPAALAAAEERGLSGRDLMLAYHVGNEIACKCNDAIFPRHYEAGFHSTGTIGTLGAAAAAAKAFGFSEQEIATTLGIAASQAGGLRENFGTTIKPVHAGRAAESGIVSADLTGLGASASTTILDSERGFFGAFADGSDPAVIEQKLGAPWALLDPGSLLKAYPSGAVSHAAMTLLERLIAESDVRPEQVRKLTVLTQPKIKKILIHPKPTSGIEAKFSLPYNLAILLLRRRAGLPEFEDDFVRSDAVRDMLGRIEHEVYEPKPDYGNLTAFLKLELTDGRVFEGREDFAKGSPQRPMTLDDVIVKFHACAAAADVSEAKAQNIIDLVLNLEKLDDVRKLTSVLASA